jgi:Tfp pilus assembly protein PilV
MRTVRQLRRARSGLTVVEVLAALVIVSVGLLGMAGTTTVLLRAATTSAQERQALRRLELRLALLNAGGCQRAISGSAGDPGDGVTERWTVDAVNGAAALVELRTDWRDGARVRQLVRRSAILC